MYVYTFLYIYVSLCVYIYMYIYICIHIYIYMYIDKLGHAGFLSSAVVRGTFRGLSEYWRPGRKAGSMKLHAETAWEVWGVEVEGLGRQAGVQLKR